jgi:uncharacterized membrane protein
MAFALPRRALGTAIPASLVVGAATLGSIWWAHLALRRADGLATPAFDLAYFQQLVWSIAEGRGFRSSFNPGDFLGLHFSPLLAVPAALQPIWSDARLLSLLQVAALGLAVPAAFLFVRAVLQPARAAGWVAAALTAPMIVWPITQQQVRADFHPEALALPLVFLAGWAGLTRRPALMYAAATLALLAREDQIYPIAVMGILVAARAPGRWRQGMRRHGMWLVATAAAWGVLVFGVLKPVLRNGAVYDTDAYYRWLGQGPEIVLAPFRHSDAVVTALTRPAGWIVAGWLLLSLGGLALLRPRWLLLLVPPIGAHLLSRQVPQQQILLQYGLLLVVPAVVASALGARRAIAIVTRAARGPGPAAKRGRSAVSAIVGAGLVLVVALAGVAAFGGGAVPPFSSADAPLWNRPASLDRLRSIAAQVPREAPLAVDWGLASAIASRPAIQLLERVSDDAYVLLDRDPYQTGWVPWSRRDALLKQLPGSGRPLLVDDGRFVLWGPAGG